MEAPELGGAERGTEHGGVSETMMLVRGMYLSAILGSGSLAACLCAGRSAGSLYGGVRRVGLTLRYPHFLTWRNRLEEPLDHHGHG